MFKYIVPLWITLQRCIFKRISDIYCNLKRNLDLDRRDSPIKTEQNVGRARSISRSMLVFSRSASLVNHFSAPNNYYET